MSDNIIDVATNLIKTGGRFRKDFGDIPVPAESIKELGLLQPIGIDSGYLTNHPTWRNDVCMPNSDGLAQV